MEFESIEDIYKTINNFKGIYTGVYSKYYKDNWLFILKMYGYMSFKIEDFLEPEGFQREKEKGKRKGCK
jgi:hypothetical protein